MDDETKEQADPFRKIDERFQAKFNKWLNV